MTTDPTLFADGFDDAIIGLTQDITTGTNRVVYDKWKCEKLLIERDGMSEEVALEFLNFNTCESYVGKGSPIFVDPISKRDIEDYLTDTQ